MAKKAIYEQDRSTWLGRYVYENYDPNKIGKSVEILPKKPGYGFETVKVKWQDDTESIVSVKGLADVNELIEDHERNLQKHKSNLEKAKKILEQGD